MPRDDATAGKVPLRPHRVSRQRLVRLAVAAGVLLLALLLLRTLAQSHLRRTGTNDLAPVAQRTVGPGERSCQLEALVRAGTGSVTLPVQSSGPAPGRLRVTVGRSTGTAAAPTALTYAFLRLSPALRADRRDAPVCFTNEGTTPLTLLGAPLPDAGAQVRLDWFRAAKQRNWTMGSTVASRFALEKAPFLGPWAFWAALAVALALAVAALAWMLRGEEA